MVIYYLDIMSDRCGCVNEILSFLDAGEIQLMCGVVRVGGFSFVGEEAKVDEASIDPDLRPPLLGRLVPADTLES